MDVPAIPLMFPAVAVLAVAWLEWRAARAAALAALGAGFVLLTAALRWPAAGIDEVLEAATTGQVGVLLVARCVAAGCFFWAVARRVAAAGALG